MHRFPLIFTSLLLMSPIVAAEPCSEDDHQALVESAEQFLSDRTSSDDLNVDDLLIGTNNPDTCGIYQVSRLLLQQSYFDQALELLFGIEDQFNTEIFDGLTPFNTMGFGLIMLNEYDLAEEYLLQQIEQKDFADLDDVLKGRVYNNLGLAYFLLGRYEESRRQLVLALDMGNIRAAENIAKVDSQIAFLSRGFAADTGAFSTVVGTTYEEGKILQLMDEIIGRSDFTYSDFGVYQLPNQSFAITSVENTSYLRAIDFRDAARDNIDDAYVAYSVEWQAFSNPDLLAITDAQAE